MHIYFTYKAIKKITIKSGFRKHASNCFNFICKLFVLRFYGPVYPMGSCQALSWKIHVTTEKDDLVCYVPFNIIKVISRRWKDDDEGLCAMKCHTVMSWILPLEEFEPGASWSEDWSANHLATQMLTLMLLFCLCVAILGCQTMYKFEYECKISNLLLMNLKAEHLKHQAKFAADNILFFFFLFLFFFFIENKFWHFM